MIKWEIAPFIVWSLIILIGLVRTAFNLLGIRTNFRTREKRPKASVITSRIMERIISSSSNLQYTLEKRRQAFQDEYEITPDLVADYVKATLEKRIIDSFILTEAAIPSPWNTIKPVEGFRVFEDQGNGEKELKNIVVSVSAENIFPLLYQVVFWLGEQISIAITDHNQKDEKVRNYVALNKDAIILWSVFQSYRWMIQNNGDISISLWTDSGEIEFHLETTKLFVFFTKHSESVTQFLEKFGLHENNEMKFFPENGVITLNKWRNSDELRMMLNELNSEDIQPF